MSTTPTAPSHASGPVRQQVSWPWATFIALFSPVLVFWTMLVLVSGLSNRPALLLAALIWLVIAVALACFPTRGGRTVGLGLLAGLAACLPWVVIPGLVS